jgi:hypothetical protein
MRRLDVFPLLALLLLAAAPVDAAMFKWTDANGNVQYGQHPPAGVNAEPIRSTPAPKTTPGTVKSPQQRLEELEKQQEAEHKLEAETARKQQDIAQRKANCEHARKNMERLENYGGNRLVQMPDGSYQRLDEERRQSMIEENRKAVKEYCN